MDIHLKRITLKYIYKTYLSSFLVFRCAQNALSGSSLGLTGVVGIASGSWNPTGVLTLSHINFETIVSTTLWETTIRGLRLLGLLALPWSRRSCSRSDVTFRRRGRRWGILSSSPCLRDFQSQTNRVEDKTLTLNLLHPPLTRAG